DLVFANKSCNLRIDRRRNNANSRARLEQGLHFPCGNLAASHDNDEASCQLYEHGKEAHRQPSTPCGTLALGKSRATAPTTSPAKIVRICSLVCRARKLRSDSVPTFSFEKLMSRRSIASGTSVAAQRKPTGRAIEANCPILPPTQK